MPLDLVIDCWVPRVGRYTQSWRIRAVSPTQSALAAHRFLGRARLQTLSRSSAAAGVIISRVPPARFLTSTLPSARPFGPISTCQGRPIRSAVANLLPARSSRSSYSASTPLALQVAR